ncbi:MAG TPA: thioredoxin domain-containing protein [Symbiobacteriaceae bacterium]|nr:thioredoxin domain-containing protein [Symbiobacteriaceae bacterium]
MAAATVEPQLAALIEAGEVSYEYRHLLVFPPRSQWAAEASECAADQGKFWAYHDLLFKNQKATMTQAQLKTWAKDLGLDTNQFNQCMDTKKYEAKVKQQSAEGAKMGINQTPTFVLNGKILKGYSNDAVVTMVKQAVNQK